MADQQRVTESSEEAQVVAAYLLTHVGGDETDPGSPAGLGREQAASQAQASDGAA